ncbi:hypothetical protein GA0061105_1397 [Rhizobium aethiopicum]|uniref:Uncharacterized protein n=1 Tax=Rhizobium aethiopicum TaxID=1138170 RepID=A0A1C3YCR2_9HYPH|nr:hypothetical protein GA0061105_1397 [Rhizobium aethiopicum]
MKSAILLLSLLPGHKIGHPTGRIAGRCSFEDNTQAATVFIEGLHIVGQCLPISAVPFILCRMGEEITVQLADMIFVERDGVEGCENSLHYRSIACDLLLVAAGK